MELDDYLRALRNHWLGASLLTVAFALLAFGYSSAQPKVYAATSSGFVGTGASFGGSSGAVNDSLARSRATSYVNVAKGRATAQAVIDDLGLETKPSTLVGSVEVVQPPETVILNVTARAGSPIEAQELADSWINALAAQVREIEAPNAESVPDGTPRIIPIESAELPSSPIEPNVSRFTFLGFGLGCVFGLAYAVARRSLDRRIRTSEDIEQLVSVPVVGAIPSSSSVAESRAGEDFAAAEAFRKLRTNLVFMDVDNPPQTIVVTSARPGDGKSAVSQNLATTLAQSGQSVILVDADLRRPTLADRLGLETGLGLTTVLSGRISIEDALQGVTGIPGLKFLAAGALPPNPSELLGSQAMKALIEKLGRGATVILDTPPLLPVTDAAVLSTSADGAFVVISSGSTLDTELTGALDQLNAVNARTLGLVLNRIGKRDTGYGAGYYSYASAGADGSKPRSRRPWRRGSKARPGPEVAVGHRKDPTPSGRSLRPSRRARRDETSPTVPAGAEWDPDQWIQSTLQRDASARAQPEPLPDPDDQAVVLVDVEERAPSSPHAQRPKGTNRGGRSNPGQPS